LIDDVSLEEEDDKGDPIIFNNQEILERKVEIEHLDTRVSENGDLYIAVRTTRVHHIRNGILLNNLGSVGKIEEYEKKINLNSDRKRFWLGEVKSLNDKTFCDSVPINVSLDPGIVSKPQDITWEDESEAIYQPTSEF
jgi:hypothetical protein